MSKRQNIIDLVVARMRTILISNDYETDLGENVADWETNWDDSQMPAVSVCDLINKRTPVGGNPVTPTGQCALPIQLRIFTKSDARPADLRKMISDVIKAIGTDQFWADEDGKKLAMYTLVTDDGIRLIEDSFEIGGAAVEIEIAYLVGSFES
jgi:hypothetical protein